MSYINKVLQPDETVLYQTSLSWTLYFKAFGLGILAALCLLAGIGYMQTNQWIAVGAAIILAVGAAASFLHAWFRRWTTEIAVTDRRIILKRGLIRRHTVEMNMDKVESVDVDQTIVGRLFNYGTVTIRGVGSTFEPVRMIDRPLQFRSTVTAR